MASRALYRSNLHLVHGFSRQNRTFRTMSALKLKEDGNRTPEELERKKQEQIKKAERGEGEWHESLASSGEANIKADKQQPKDHQDHIKKLQKDTAKKGEKGEI